VPTIVPLGVTIEQMLMFDASQVASVAEACAAETLDKTVFDLETALEPFVMLKIERHTANDAVPAMPNAETIFLAFMFYLFRVKKKQ
jgi:hypothetical protein